jgi:hypothetical protein
MTVEAPDKEMLVTDRVDLEGLLRTLDSAAKAELASAPAVEDWAGSDLLG